MTPELLDHEPINPRAFALEVHSRALHNLALMAQVDSTGENSQEDVPLVTEDEYRKIMTPTFVKKAAQAKNIVAFAQEAEAALCEEVFEPSIKQLRQARRDARRAVICEVFGEGVLSHGLSFTKIKDGKVVEDIKARNEERARITVLTALIEAAQEEASGAYGLPHLDRLSDNVYHGIVNYGDGDYSGQAYDLYRSPNIVRVKPGTIEYCVKAILSL